MKHILNDLSEQEKNSIREQHTGGIKVMTESFSKLINSKLGDSKPLVSEQVEEMDEQTQMPGFTPQMNQLYDFIKKNSIEMGAVVKVMEFMKSAKPA